MTYNLSSAACQCQQKSGMYQTKLMSLNEINWVEEWFCTWCPCYPSKKTNAWWCLHPSRPLRDFINDASGQGCIDSPIVNFHCHLRIKQEVGALVDTHPAIPTAICIRLNQGQTRMATGYDNIWSDDLWAVNEYRYSIDSNIDLDLH